MMSLWDALRMNMMISYQELIRTFLSHSLRPEIGCVGAKLYYPNDTLQHGGVILGIGGVANHSHKH
ncbi:hypothetical protein U9819_26780, partial [Escherichia coli]